MKGVKTVYICSECEYTSPKWMGKCTACGAWNSFVEDVIENETKASVPKRIAMNGGGTNHTQKFEDLDLPSYMRSETGLGELDRVLGGGLVHGSVVLLSGEPGIGKSTLLMQISDALGNTDKGGKPRNVLYISG